MGVLSKKRNIIKTDGERGGGVPQVVTQLPLNPLAVIFGLSSLSYIFFVDLHRRVAQFLGKELSDEQVIGLAAHLDFNAMKNNAAVNKERCECKGPNHGIL
jgi:hypothetical protein